MNKTKIILINTSVIILPKDWLSLIDRRATFYPVYGWVINQTKQEFILDDIAQERLVMEIQLKNGNMIETAGWEYDETEVFDKAGFSGIIEEEVKKLDKELEKLLEAIEPTEGFIGRIPEKADFIRGFWLARLESMKQEVRFKKKKIVKLLDLNKKVGRKLDKMNK